MNIEKKVVEIVRSYCDGMPDNYSCIDLFEEGYLDSLAVMMLISEFDIAFDIEIDIDDVIRINFNTIEHIVSLVKKYKN